MSWDAEIFVEKAVNGAWETMYQIGISHSGVRTLITGEDNLLRGSENYDYMPLASMGEIDWPEWAIDSHSSPVDVYLKECALPEIYRFDLVDLESFDTNKKFISGQIGWEMPECLKELEAVFQVMRNLGAGEDPMHVRAITVFTF